jgi:hypothetical protein
VTGAVLTRMNTFRSTNEEREDWDRQIREEGFKDFTAFVRARLNGGTNDSTVEQAQTEPEDQSPVPPSSDPAPSAHHPNCTCTVCKARKRG